MKKSLYIVVALFVITMTAPVQAQKLYAGVLGGSNSADLDIKFADNTITDYEILSRTLFSAGGFIGVYFNKYLSVQLEPMFVAKGGVFRLRSTQDLRIKSNQIELPLILKAEFGDMIKPFILGGGFLSFVLDASIETEMAGKLWEGDLAKVLNSTELGVMLGAGISIPLWQGLLFAEGRYALGLTNLNKGGYVNLSSGSLLAAGPQTNPNDEINTIGIQILIGYQLPIFR